MICTYDKFSTNSYMNQIVKSTISLLLRSDITNAGKKELRKWMIYFSGMKELDVHRINWKIPYNQNNQTYRMLISVCYLVVKGLLQTQSDGSMKLMDFLDEQQMYRLYEKFVLEYYRREFPQITTSAPRISWQLDDDKNEHLPIMQSDVMLSYMDKVLIIDTKYYGRIMQERYGMRTIHSANLYQIFTYVTQLSQQIFSNKACIKDRKSVV